MLDSATMSKKPNGKRLNESQRCEIIAKLSKTNAPSKRAIAREYDVSEGAIRKVWDKQEQILERSALMSDEAKEKTFRSSIGHFTELEDMLYIWCRNPNLAKCGGEAQHLEKLGIWGPSGLPNVQSSTAGPKTPRIGVFLVSLERS